MTQCGAWSPGRHCRSSLSPVSQACESGGRTGTAPGARSLRTRKETAATEQPCPPRGAGAVLELSPCGGASAAPPQPLSEPPDRHDREPHRWQRKGASCVWNQGCRVLQARSGLKNHQACSLHTPGKGTTKRVTELSCPESYFRTWTPLFYVQVLDPLLHKADEQHLIEMRILGPHLRTTEPGTFKKNF